MPASETAPQKHVLILTGGVITVELRLDTLYFPHCLLAEDYRINRTKSWL